MVEVVRSSLLWLMLCIYGLRKCHQRYSVFCWYVFISGGWVKIQLELTTPPPIKCAPCVNCSLVVCGTQRCCRGARRTPVRRSVWRVTGWWLAENVNLRSLRPSIGLVLAVRLGTLAVPPVFRSSVGPFVGRSVSLDWFRPLIGSLPLWRLDAQVDGWMDGLMMATIVVCSISSPL